MGPYDAADWLTMLALKQSIKQLEEKRKESFVLKHEKKLFKKYLNKEAA